MVGEREDTSVRQRWGGQFGAPIINEQPMDEKMANGTTLIKEGKRNGGIPVTYVRRCWARLQ